MSTDWIQSLWIGPRLGAIERLCLASFVHHGHKVRLFTYAAVEDVPTGVEILSAAEILPEDAIFRTNAGSYANFADMFRYKLLSEHGGWWIDCDMLCLRPWQSPLETIVCSTDEFGRGCFANVFALRAPPGSKLMRACFEECSRLGDQRFEFAHTGPFLMERIVREHNCPEVLAAAEVFAPVPWNSVLYFVVNRPFIRHLFHVKNLLRRRHLVPSFTRSTIGTHLWSGMWASSGLDPNKTTPYSSLYSSFRRKYLP